MDEKGESTGMIIRYTTELYNSISAQWNNYVYFINKIIRRKHFELYTFINKSTDVYFSIKQLEVWTAFL